MTQDADRRRSDIDSHLLQLLSTVTDYAMVVVDEGGLIVRWFAGADELFGYSAEAAPGLPAAPLFDLTPEELAAHLDRARRDGQVTWEGSCRRRDGTTFVGVTTVQADAAGDRPRREFSVIVRDETVPRDLQERLRQGQKMEAIGQLAGGVAHDFNNLLTAILGNAEWLEQDAGLTEGNRRRVVEIKRAAEHAADMTRQLMELGRRRTVETTVIDLSVFVGGILPMLRRLIGEHISIVSETAAEPLPLLTDRGQLEQIMLNLAVNGRDAMPDGGRLTIRTRGEHVEAGKARSDLAPGAYVVLEVSDTGAGMDETTRARVLEPFFTTRPGHGTGLGLATVNGIVKQLGGAVRIDSAPGHGTSFRLCFPRTDADVSVFKVDVPDDAPGGDETVLLVEDDTSVRVLLERVLTGKGYHVLAAEHPAAAVTLVEQYVGPIDIIVTDVVMPGGNGIELVGMLDEIRPGLPVLYISGYADPSRVGQGALSESDHFLQKPFSASALLSRIRSILPPPV